MGKDKNLEDLANQKTHGVLDNISILWKFNILFILMTIVPAWLFIEFYFQLWERGAITIDLADFKLTLMWVYLAYAVGYIAIRSTIKRLISFTKASSKALENILDPEAIEELSKEKNEIAVLAQSFKAVNDRLKENVKSLEVAKKTLHNVLAKVGHGISNMENIDSFLELIVETVTEALNANKGALMIFDDEKKNLRVNTVYGVDTSKLTGRKITKEQEGALFAVIAGKKPIILAEMEQSKDFSEILKTPLICAPLVHKDEAIGVITVCSSDDKTEFTADEMNLLFNLALQTSVALENSKLSEDIEQTYFETISALALAVDAKDKYSRGHLDRVANYSKQIGEAMNLSSREIKTLTDAARLHDLGKIGIPDEVLGKTSPLNVSEWVLMQRHPSIGESIIKPIRSLNHLCDIIRHHHEKLDGSGYPDGLKGDQISELVRITTVADIFDALTTDRPYRKKFSSQRAFAELRKMEGKIDMSIVDVFEKATKSKKD